MADNSFNNTVNDYEMRAIIKITQIAEPPPFGGGCAHQCILSVLKVGSKQRVFDSF